MRRTKRESFEFTASARVQRILDTLDLLWQCSSTQGYEYTDKDVEAIFTAIREKLDFVEAAFVPVKKPVKKKFKLDR